jgi:hypothetical protein
MPLKNGMMAFCFLPYAKNPNPMAPKITPHTNVDVSIPSFLTQWVLILQRLSPLSEICYDCAKPSEISHFDYRCKIRPKRKLFACFIDGSSGRVLWQTIIGQ